MSALERWWSLLEVLRVRLGTEDKPASYGVLASKLGVHENTVLNWTKTVPGIKHEEGIAAVAGMPVKDLAYLLDAARSELTSQRIEEERAKMERQRRAATARPQPGTAGAPVAPWPKRIPRAAAPPSRAPRRRRRALGGLILALASGTLLGPTPAGAGSRLISSYAHPIDYAADSRDSVASRRRRAA